MAPLAEAGPVVHLAAAAAAAERVPPPSTLSPVCIHQSHKIQKSHRLIHVE